MTDPFTPDAFSLNSLTAAINNLVYAPARLGELGWFEEQGVSTLDVSIEERDGVLDLVDVAPRGGPGQVVTDKPRKAYPFRVPHLPERASILADEVQGVRAFGSESQAEVLQTRIDQRLQVMRRNIDYTIEAHRIQTIQGMFYDHNGVLGNLFTIFGVTETTVSVALSVDTTEMKQVALDIIEAVEAGLDGVPFTGVRVLCSPDFWRDLIVHPTIKETYLNTQMAASLRGDPRMTFDFGGITWERYRGAGSVSIPAGQARAVPEGVPGLLITRYAPADYNETVNTVGLPYYARSEPIKMNKGFALEAQSNPINLATRPGALIKLVKT
jgi:hypothetical protein